MTDSIAVLSPGDRVTDNNGDLITDGVLAFFDSGTTTPKTVYSDAALSVSLGTTVNCNSAGYPVTGANAKTLIYTGTAAYKVRLTSAIFGGTVWEHDGVKGALDTSPFLTTAVVANKTILNKNVDYTITTADKGKLINVNCTSGTLTMTLNAAATLTSGFWVGIRHGGTANQVKIISNGADTFGLNGVTVVSFSLTGLGQVAYISCDGTSFLVDGEVQELIGNTIGVIKIADRLSTPPGSPTPGARYLVTASPAGAWSTFSVHDIAEANGFGGWFKYTPAADCGWKAYVQDEDQFYSFRGSVWTADNQNFSVRGLTITNNATTPTTQLDVSCDDAYIGTHTDAVAVTINAAATGANGLDTGALANTTWYNVFLISNGLTTAALLSTSATAPTMPSGYVYKMRIGAVRTGGSATFLRTLQKGNRTRYQVVSGSTTPNLPIMASGTSGSTTVPTWTAVAWANYAPPTAVFISVGVRNDSANRTMAAPNNAYGAAGSQTNPPPLLTNSNSSGPADFMIESANIYYASASGADGVLWTSGWTDSVNAS